MRTLTASTALTDYLKWSGLAQVYQYRTERTPEPFSFQVFRGFSQEVATGRSLGQRRYLEQQDRTTGQLNGSGTHTHPKRKKERYDTIWYHKSNA